VIGRDQADRVPGRPPARHEPATDIVRPVLAIWNPDDRFVLELLYIVHIITVVTAFGPLFMYPRLQRAGETQAIGRLHMRLVFPSLVVLWVAGMGMAGISKINIAETYWIGLSIVLWVGAIAVSWFLIRPSISDTSPEAVKKMSAGIGVSHLIFVVTLVLMITKPFVENGYVFNP